MILCESVRVCFLHLGYFVVSSLCLGINLSWFVSDFVYQIKMLFFGNSIHSSAGGIDKCVKSHKVSCPNDQNYWREDSTYPKLLICLFVFTRLVCNLFALTLPHMFVSVRLIMWVTHYYSICSLDSYAGFMLRTISDYLSSLESVYFHCVTQRNVSSQSHTGTGNTVTLAFQLI